MKLQDSTDQEIKGYFDIVSSNIAKMYNMVDNILNFSRLNSQDQSFEIVDTNEIIDKIRSLISEELSNKSTQILSAILPPVKANKVHLWSVFKS